MNEEQARAAWDSGPGKDLPPYAANIFGPRALYEAGYLAGAEAEARRIAPVLEAARSAISCCEWDLVRGSTFDDELRILRAALDAYDRGEG